MTRRRRKRPYVKIVPRIVQDVADVIEFVLTYHSLGMLVFLGEIDFPTTQELYDTLSALEAPEDNERVQGGKETPLGQRIVERTEKIQQTVKAVGGVSSFVREFKRLKAESIEEFDMLRDMTVLKRGRPFRYAGGWTSVDLAARHNMAPSTMRRNKGYIVLKLAHEIAYPGAVLPVWKQIEKVNARITR